MLIYRYYIKGVFLKSFAKTLSKDFKNKLFILSFCYHIILIKALHVLYSILFFWYIDTHFFATKLPVFLCSIFISLCYITQTYHNFTHTIRTRLRTLVIRISYVRIRSVFRCVIVEHLNTIFHLFFVQWVVLLLTEPLFLLTLI